MYVLSIDVGFEHLGLIGAEVSEDYSLDTITLCKLVNIKKLVTECRDHSCTLRHDLCITDYMYHFFNAYKEDFERCDLIVVERQPPKGFIAVQELIIYRYRDKTILVSPNSIHKYFSMPKTQEFRKMFTVSFANPKLSKFLDYERSNRKHDMSDAYCQLVYYLSTKTPKKKPKTSLETVGYLGDFTYLGD